MYNQTIDIIKKAFEEAADLDESEIQSPEEIPPKDAYFCGLLSESLQRFYIVIMRAFGAIPDDEFQQHEDKVLYDDQPPAPRPVDVLIELFWDLVAKEVQIPNGCMAEVLCNWEVYALPMGKIEEERSINLIIQTERPMNS